MIMAFAKMTLIGLINHYNTPGVTGDLFDLMTLPEGIDKNTVINNILMKGGEFETLWPNADYTRAYIGVWSNKWYMTFDKWYKALQLQYQPLYNYDRIESITDNGTTTGTHTGSTTDGKTINETVANTGTQTNATTYNSDLTESKTGNDTSTKTDNTTETNETDGHVSISRHNLDESTTNGTVTQTVDTKNNQTRNESTTNNGVTTTHNVSAFNSSTPVFDNSDAVTGGSSTTVSYTGTDPDRQTTTTSVDYGSATGDIKESTGTDTTTDTTTTTKSNTGTTTDQNTYNSSIEHEKRGNDTNLRTDDLRQVTTNTISGNGSITDTTNGTSRNVRDGNIYGTTGTSKQELLKKELEIATWNLYDHIADIFIKEFCLRIYI